MLLAIPDILTGAKVRQCQELLEKAQWQNGRLPDDPSLVRLTGLYHNLLRQWSEA